ncbi:MAG: iron ABC transporter permease [Chitinispirillaceae bacterium]|nr:iron ABC transporter permease [Chitinispirillaceae bacterium]
MKTCFSSRIALLVLLAAVAVVTVGTAAFLGMKIITPAAAFAAESLDHDIFWKLRVPRVLAAFCAGSGLALCGMVFQAVFRNPLADPFTLGTASGASCGAAVTILLGIAGSFAGIPLISIGAFIGAVAAMASVYAIASLKKSSSGITMLLAGIAVSFLFSSILMFFQYMSSYRDSFQIVRWLMGGIQVTGYGSLFSLFSFWAVGVALIAARLPALDQLSAGEELARSRGVDVAAAKQWLLVAATLVIAGIVAVCGPIGFVGLMVPHICRRLVGASHLFLGPASVFLGGTLLVVADTVCRIIIAPAELPVGVLTALIGGPFFLWLLFGRRGVRESAG